MESLKFGFLDYSVIYDTFGIELVTVFYFSFSDGSEGSSLDDMDVSISYHSPYVNR